MIRLGIAGIGTIANVYLNLIQAGQVQGVQISALSSRNPVNLDNAIKQHGLNGVACFTDYETMLDSGLIDAVLICTPHHEHPAMARLALRHNLHFLVDKPIGVDPCAVQDLLASMAAKPSLVGGVLYNRRQASAYQRIHRLLKSGELGELVRVTWVITNLYRTQAYYQSGSWRGTWAGEGGGLLMTQASHQLDLLQWLCGMPNSVKAKCRTIDRPIDVENEAVLLLEFPGQAWGHFIASARETPGSNHLEIACTKGTISLVNDSDLQVWRLTCDERDFARAAAEPFVQPSHSVERYFHNDQDNQIQQAAAIQNFIDTVTGKAAIACDLADAAQSLAIIQGAYLSDWTGQTVQIPFDADLFKSELALHVKSPPAH